MNNNISDKDKKDWENFLSEKETLIDKDEEANKTIENFINTSYVEGLSKLIIVTGKGLRSQNDKDPYVSKDLGILRYSVPDFIKKKKRFNEKD